MRITESVDLPQSLIDAQRNQELVVFAGAGISIGPPSNLPDFEQLAMQVAAGALVPAKDEPLDRFLGRLEAERGVLVHRRAWKMISDPGSKATRLHYSILSLFQSPATVRVVTTNFDRHFSIVAQKLFKEDLEVYCGPALPLGREFNGLVYLHGFVDKGAQSLVLTDADFGRAYLTEGWATRFLYDMFAKYTVVFVGYSHDDPVMGYLARGLVPKTSRYAFTPSGQDERWKFLGIVPVPYRPSDEPNRHRALTKALAAWVRLSKMGALDHEQQIRDIVRSTPPLDKETADYIEGALTDLVTLRFFARYSHTPEWLRWVESKGILRKLFQPNEPVDEKVEVLATWFAQNFACKYPDDALALVERQGQQLNPALQRAIAHILAFGKPRTDPCTRARWVTVLLRGEPSNQPLRLLGYVLEHCQYPEDKITALLLFEYLSRPHLKLRSHFSLPDESGSQTQKVDADIVVEGDEHLLKRSWEVIFRPNFAHFYQELEPLLTNHLIKAHFSFRAMGQATEHSDPVSFLRSAIELHEQDRYGDKLDLVIDAARDLIEWMLQQEPGRARAAIEAWSTSGVPLLKRLAIHGVTESPQMDSDEKIGWLLDNDYLYVSHLKHEVFRLLAQVYANASRPARTRLLKRIDRGPVGPDAKALGRRRREKRAYNLFVWLCRAAPSCSLAADRLKAMEEAHPDFRPPDRLDFRTWTVEWEGTRSPVTVEELLNKNPDEEVGWLLTYQGDEFAGPDREGLLIAITNAAGQSFRWSWQLVVALAKRREWRSDIWGSVLSGWQKTPLTKNQWRRVLNLVTHRGELLRFPHSVAELLEQGISREHGVIPLSCLSLAENLAGKLFDACAKNLLNEEDLETQDWLLRAINHPGGKTVEFWLRALSKRHAQTGQRWRGLPMKYKQYFEKAISGTSSTAELGRVLLASQLRFLFALDAEWCREKILPLLDWSGDERQAQQAWHGYLDWGRWHEALLPNLLPLYEQAFPKLSSELLSKRERFCEHLASIALYSSSNPMSDGWLQQFLLEADPGSHKSWASSIGSQLLGVNKQSIQDLWRRWMDDYWSQRNTGVPLLLSEAEKAEMLLWILPLEPIFPVVVEKICATSAPDLKHTQLYYELVEKKFARKYPEPLTRLLQHLLSNAHEPFLHCREVEQLVRSLVDSTVPRPQLRLLCNHLARLGCPSADELGRLAQQSA